MGAGNNLKEPLVSFCLALEEARRESDDARVRTADELLEWLFRHDANGAQDLIFSRMPRETRGPILSAWGIRGAKAALRDDDDKVREVVHDALLAGDLDASSFEDGIAPEKLIRWVPLQEFWGFWRAGKLTNGVVQRALGHARERALFDDEWLLGAVNGRGGRAQGTDAIADWLSKDGLVAWIRAIAASRDGSPKGIVDALGWDTLLSKAPAEALLSVLDALAKRLGLVPTSIAPEARRSSPAVTEAEAVSPAAKSEPKLAGAAPPEKSEPRLVAAAPAAEPAPPPEPEKRDPAAVAKADEPPASHDDLEDASDLVEDAPDSLRDGVRRDTGLPVAIPDSPAVDAGEERWDGDGESARLAAAREAVMTSMGKIDETRTEAPARPSTLDWDTHRRNTPTPTDQITIGQGPKPRTEARVPATDAGAQKAARLDPNPRKIPRPSK